MKNIYDLEGNYFEWTAEACNTDSRTLRGGYYGNANYDIWNSASHRNSNNPTLNFNNYSSRPTLYVEP